MTHELIPLFIFCAVGVVGCQIFTYVCDERDDVILAAHSYMVLLFKLLHDVEEESGIAAVDLQIEQTQHVVKHVIALAILEKFADIYNFFSAEDTVRSHNIKQEKFFGFIVGTLLVLQTFEKILYFWSHYLLHLNFRNKIQAVLAVYQPCLNSPQHSYA